MNVKTTHRANGISRRAALSALIGLPALAGGCRWLSHSSNASELIIWSQPTGVEERGFERLCRRFEREHPGITVYNLGGSDVEKLVRAVVAGAPPDLAYLYGATMVGPLAANSAVQPLDTYFHQAGFQETDFLPTTMLQNGLGGKLYAMPVTRDSRALYWNRKVFRENGLDPDRPPETLEAMLDLAKRLTKRAADGTLERIGVFLPEEPWIVFALFGGSVWDEQTGQITANRPENIAALRWMVELSNAQGGYVAVSALAAGFGRSDTAQNPIATGKVAMKIEGEWAAMHLEKFAPGTDYAVGPVPYPTARPDLKNMAWMDGDVMLIPIGARRPELAWEFIRWMQQPEQQEEYALHMNNLPSIVALRDSPRFQQGSKSRRVLGYVLKEIAVASTNPRYFPALPVTQLYQNRLRTAFDQALYEEKTPEAALNEVQTYIAQEMTRYA
jgi:multiple sugar transport system substrate-binding protein